MLIILKIILNETVDSGITEEIPGKYFGPFYMLCPAPASRQKRSTADEGFALGYRLSVSNDGKNFTEELTILIYNTQCLYCNITSLDCIELVSRSDNYYFHLNYTIININY